MVKKWVARTCLVALAQLGFLGLGASAHAYEPDADITDPCLIGDAGIWGVACNAFSNGGSRVAACLANCIETFLSQIDDRCGTWWCTILPGCSQGCYQAATHNFELCSSTCLADHPN